jgi:hypothetical protein
MVCPSLDGLGQVITQERHQRWRDVFVQHFQVEGIIMSNAPGASRLY